MVTLGEGLMSLSHGAELRPTENSAAELSGSIFRSRDTHEHRVVGQGDIPRGTYQARESPPTRGPAASAWKQNLASLSYPTARWVFSLSAHARESTP
jgi:hypothetical protein